MFYSVQTKHLQALEPRKANFLTIIYKIMNFVKSAIDVACLALQSSMFHFVKTFVKSPNFKELKELEHRLTLFRGGGILCTLAGGGAKLP